MWVAAASIDVRVLSSFGVGRCRSVVVRNASTTVGSNWVPAWARSSWRAASGDRDVRGGGAQFRGGGVGREALAVGAVGGHGFVGVAHGDDAGPEGDLLAGEPVGVAGYVPAVVALAAGP